MEPTQTYIDHNKFFTSIRGAGKLFPTLTQRQTDRLNAYLTFAERLKLNKHWLAYIMATVYHETGVSINGVMQRFIPVEETGKGAKRPYGKRIKYDGKAYTDTNNLYYGRGDVQLTWYEVYQKAERVLAIKGLWANPAMALEDATAMDIAVRGMIIGLFTGRKLSSYDNKDGTFNYKAARAIINGSDKADLIAGYAQKFYEAMS
jgi:hypothetical protein